MSVFGIFSQFHYKEISLVVLFKKNAYSSIKLTGKCSRALDVLELKKWSGMGWIMRLMMYICESKQFSLC